MKTSYTDRAKIVASRLQITREALGWSQVELCRRTLTEPLLFCQVFPRLNELGPAPMPPCRRSPDSAFLMTPEQYLAQAESLRATGNEYLAQQYDNLFKLRTGEWPLSPSIVPE